MSKFIRVRIKDGPGHEFDVPLIDYKRRPDRYVVVDDTPVGKSRPPKHAPARKPRRKKPAENNTDAPEGAD